MKTWPIIIFLTQCLSVIAISSPVAQADPILRLAVPDDYPPYYYQDERGQFKGASYEIATHILTKLGYSFEITQFPAMRLMLAALDNGQQDLAFNLTATEARLEVAFFTNVPHIYESQNLIVRADSAVGFSGDLEALSDYKFGPIFGWTYGPVFDNAGFLQKEYVNNSRQQLKGLLSGNYEIALNNPQYVHSLATKLGIPQAFKVLEPPVFNLPVTMAVSRQYPGAKNVIDTLNRELTLFKQQPEYREILSRNGFDLADERREETP